MKLSYQSSNGGGGGGALKRASSLHETAALAKLQ